MVIAFREAECELGKHRGCIGWRGRSHFCNENREFELMIGDFFRGGSGIKRWIGYPVCRVLCSMLLLVVNDDLRSVLMRRRKRWIAFEGAEARLYLPPSLATIHLTPPNCDLRGLRSRSRSDDAIPAIRLALAALI